MINVTCRCVNVWMLVCCLFFFSFICAFVFFACCRTTIWWWIKITPTSHYNFHGTSASSFIVAIHGVTTSFILFTRLQRRKAVAILWGQVYLNSVTSWNLTLPAVPTVVCGISSDNIYSLGVKISDFRILSLYYLSALIWHTTQRRGITVTSIYPGVSLRKDYER